MITFAHLLCPNRPVDLPLVMLFGLPEHCQQHDPSISSTPVGDPRCNITKPDPKLPNWSFKVIGPRATKFAPLLGEHAAHFVGTLEIAVAKAVEPVANLRFQFEVVQAPYPVVHKPAAY